VSMRTDYRLIDVGGEQLTCIEDSRLTCDPNTLERGRPLCRLIGENIP
jgi:hypothetical protein